MSERTQQLDIVFDGPPGPESGRFVEVETVREGESIRVGKWIDRGDGTWALRLTAVVSDPPAHVPGTNILDGQPWGTPRGYMVDGGYLPVLYCSKVRDGHEYGGATFEVLVEGPRTLGRVRGHGLKWLRAEDVDPRTPDPARVTPLVAPGMTDLMVSPEAIDDALSTGHDFMEGERDRLLTDLEITSVGPIYGDLAVDPDYACGAAYCDDPACNTHSHRPDLVLKRGDA